MHDLEPEMVFDDATSVFNNNNYLNRNPFGREYHHIQI